MHGECPLKIVNSETLRSAYSRLNIISVQYMYYIYAYINIVDTYSVTLRRSGSPEICIRLFNNMLYISRYD